MNRILLAMAMAGTVSVPAFAQDMTCADFMAMDAAGQMEAMESMSAMESGDAMAEDDAMAAEGDAMATEDDTMAAEGAMTPEAVATACAENPDMMVNDAMHGG